MGQDADQCQCESTGEAAFYCPRHRCVKAAHFGHLCRTRRDYFEAWETGRGIPLCIGTEPVFCTFETVTDRVSRCSRCGKRWSGQPPANRLCRYKPRAVTIVAGEDGTRQVLVDGEVVAATGCCGGEPPREMPSLLAQATNLAGSMAAFAADFAKSGADAILTDEAVDARLAVCGACDRLAGHRCLECGCFVALAAQLRSKDCPLGKWPKQET